jgi:olefin beta-lactone synthetase
MSIALISNKKTSDYADFLENARCLPDLLRFWSEKYPSRVVLVSGRGGNTRRVTYGELQFSVERKTHALRRAGVAYGDRVLVLQEAGIDLFVTLIALFEIGAPAILFDNRETFASALGSKILDSIEPGVLIADSAGLLISRIYPALSRIPLRISSAITSGADFALSSIELGGRLPVFAESPALISFTSGSSGNLKIIERSHGFLLEQLRKISQEARIRPGSSELVTMPVFVLANIALGVKSIIAPGKCLFAYPGAKAALSGKIRALVEQILEHRPERLLVSPRILELILLQLEKSKIEAGFIKQVITGGGPVFAGLEKLVVRVLPAARMVAVYGSSEAEPIASSIRAGTAKEAELTARGAGLPAGRPAAGTNILIMPVPFRKGESLKAINRRFSAFQHVCQLTGVSYGDIGEILVSGSHVNQTYFKGIGDQENKLSYKGHIWHRTGDIGYLDTSGALWLLGRISSSPGLDTSYSLAVEACAASLLPERRAAFVASDLGLGLGLGNALYIEGKSPVALLETLRARLGFASLSKIEFMEELPRDQRHHSKILYQELENRGKKSNIWTKSILCFIHRLRAWAHRDRSR